MKLDPKSSKGYITWKAIGLHDHACTVLLQQVAVELCDRVLIGVDGHPVQINVFRSDDLDIVLEHVQALCSVDSLIIQRVVHAGNLLSKAEVLDMVRKVQSLLEVLLNVVDVHVSVLEGTTRGNVEVSCDFVDGNLTMQSASLVRLLFHLVHVSLTNALDYLETLNTDARQYHENKVVIAVI